jgi:hypothetical protein
MVSGAQHEEHDGEGEGQRRLLEVFDVRFVHVRAECGSASPGLPPRIPIRRASEEETRWSPR